MEKKDPKYLGIPNICFSLSDNEDPREEQFSIQRKIRGFDDSETWSLRDTIGNFILPRLKTFKDIHNNGNGYDENIDLSIRAFELLVRDNGAFELTEEEEIEYDKGMKAFNEIFLELWW